MTASERRRLEKLEALKRESHITTQGAQKEESSGVKAARREELARCAAWKRWN